MAAEQNTVGAVIAEQRLRRGWTQRQLGEHLGIGTSLVAKWEQGIRIPPHEWLTELDQVLGTTMAAAHEPTRPRRGPRPGAARVATPHRTVSPTGPALVELTADGVRVFIGEREVEAVVIDLNEIEARSTADRVQRITDLLLHATRLPAPLAERVIRQLGDLV